MFFVVSWLPFVMPDDIDRDTPMTGAYAGVVAVEAIIILVLWLFGRMFS